MRFGLRHWRISYKKCQAQSLRAQIVANQVVSRVGSVAFIKQEIDDFENGVERFAQLVRGGQLEGESLFAYLALRTHQALRNCGGIAEKGPGNFLNGKT